MDEFFTRFQGCTRLVSQTVRRAWIKHETPMCGFACMLLLCRNGNICKCESYVVALPTVTRCHRHLSPLAQEPKRTRAAWPFGWFLWFQLRSMSCPLCVPIHLAVIPETEEAFYFSLAAGTLSKPMILRLCVSRLQLVPCLSQKP